MERQEKIKIEVIGGVAGKSLYVNDTRVCGEKPWGGGTVLQEFAVDAEMLFGKDHGPLRSFVETDKNLRAGLREMIESGRLTEADIPDDYKWLVAALDEASAQ